MNPKQKVVNATAFDDSEFTKSNASRENWPTCVLVARRPDVVGVRQSRDLEKTTLEFTPAEWKAFVKGVKNGEFDI